MTETANNVLGKHRPAKKPWVTDNILKLCDRRRELKQKKNTTEGAKLYREANQQVKKKGMRKAKETWIEEQCQGIEEKQQQESLPLCERTNKLETRENYYHPGQSREMSHRRTRHPEEEDRVLFRIVYTQQQEIPRCWMSLHQPTMTATLSCGKKMKPQSHH